MRAYLAQVALLGCLGAAVALERRGVQDRRASSVLCFEFESCGRGCQADARGSREGPDVVLGAVEEMHPAVLDDRRGVKNVLFLPAHHTVVPRARKVALCPRPRAQDGVARDLCKGAKVKRVKVKHPGGAWQNVAGIDFALARANNVLAISEMDFAIPTRAADRRGACGAGQESARCARYR